MMSYFFKWDFDVHGFGNRGGRRRAARMKMGVTLGETKKNDMFDAEWLWQHGNVRGCLGSFIEARANKKWTVWTLDLGRTSGPDSEF
jgi:hypothetical protein